MPGKLLHIYIVSAEGGAPREVTKGERFEFYPNWSQDGDFVVFWKLAN
jgi:Tol biopolymer transport system component